MTATASFPSVRDSHRAGLPSTRTSNGNASEFIVFYSPTSSCDAQINMELAGCHTSSSSTKSSSMKTLGGLCSVHLLSNSIFLTPDSRENYLG